MEKLTNEELLPLIKKTWQPDTEWDLASMIKSVIGGKVINHHEAHLEDRSVYFIVMKDPEFRIDDEQLCQIFDLGNHATSAGSITYEEDMVFIVWSNYGHI